MAYKRVTGEERRLIYRWRQEGETSGDGAASGTSREQHQPRGVAQYGWARLPPEAGPLRRRRCGPCGRGLGGLLRRSVCRCGVAPQRGVDPRDHQWARQLDGRPSVCKETIYKHIYADAKAGGDLWRTSRALGASVVGVAHGTMDEGEGRYRTNV
jgi:hypothetical protein